MQLLLCVSTLVLKVMGVLGAISDRDHAVGTVKNGGLRPGRTTSDFTQPVEFRGPLLSLMSLSLDTWGAKATNCSWAQSLPNFMGKAEDQVEINSPTRATSPVSGLLVPFLLKAEDVVSHSMSVGASAFFKRHVVSIMSLLILTCVLLALIWCCEGHPFDDKLQSPREEVHQDFATVEFSDGSWAQVYREARGEQKEALELLFRCNIISTEEFAFSRVSEEHIQESLWIATHMLQQKPLEEWVALWQQAQQTFEDSVTACFEARGGPNAPLSLSPYSSPSSYKHIRHLAPNLSPGSSAQQSPPAVPNLSLLSCSTPEGYSNRLNALACETEDEDDPYTTRSHYSPSFDETTRTLERQRSPSFDEEFQVPAVGRLIVPGSHQSGPIVPGSHQSGHTEGSHVSQETRWSIESELNRGLALHGSR